MQFPGMESVFDGEYIQMENSQIWKSTWNDKIKHESLL